jgi:hypothetical protein
MLLSSFNLSTESSWDLMEKISTFISWKKEFLSAVEEYFSQKTKVGATYCLTS